LEQIIEDSKMSGAESEQKLRQEIQRLLKEIDELKAKHKKEFQDL
jgi:DNA invertase Pin-like site-specific DNA recombinase